MMACASPALMNSVISTNGSIFNPSPRFFSSSHLALKAHPAKLFKVRASAAEDADCNEEECAPEKEVMMTFYVYIYILVRNLVTKFELDDDCNAC